jgi:integrase/recombinase XerD
MVAERTARRNKALPVYPNYTEVHRILDVCDNDRDRLLIEILWHTGGRVSEVIAIRVGDLTESGIRMRNLKQSIPSEKHVFVHPDFLAKLRRYSAGMSPVDILVGRLRDGRQLTRRQAYNIVTNAGIKAGVLKKRFASERLRPPWPHAYRHGNAVRLLEQSVPISAVQAQLGHANLSSTEVYVRITDPHRQKMVAGVQF